MSIVTSLHGVSYILTKLFTKIIIIYQWCIMPINCKIHTFQTHSKGDMQHKRQIIKKEHSKHSNKKNSTSKTFKKEMGIGIQKVMHLINNPLLN